MRAIVMVLAAFAICVAFVAFFAAFTQVPFLLLGLYLIVATTFPRRRGRKRPRASVAAEGTGDVEND
jgi:hypothetical protein